MDDMISNCPTWCNINCPDDGANCETHCDKSKADLLESSEPTANTTGNSKVFQWLNQGPINCGTGLLYYNVFWEGNGPTVTQVDSVNNSDISIICEEYDLNAQHGTSVAEFDCDSFDPATFCPDNVDVCEQTLSCDHVVNSDAVGGWVKYTAGCICGAAYHTWLSVDCPATASTAQCPNDALYSTTERMPTSDLCLVYGATSTTTSEEPEEAGTDDDDDDSNKKKGHVPVVVGVIFAVIIFCGASGYFLHSYYEEKPDTNSAYQRFIQEDYEPPVKLMTQNNQDEHY